ncbi:single-stranded-DNA-specific exonuclease RecJ [Opitutaceae bacterium TAV4]|nr:single-stranded-DNA-specific exonuclease RecJ [Opitutaceae bacterium TAV4]RRK01191.1 single-stranded-DNA-specific exonuclease RecJ [Opitutaceae bacterium TAV3]
MTSPVTAPSTGEQPVPGNCNTGPTPPPFYTASRTTRWLYEPAPAAQIAALTEATHVPPVIAELLVRAGVGTPAAAERFLNPALASISDPFQLQNLQAAVVRLHQAILQREDITVLGDYDVDGVTSTALLVSILRRFGTSPRFVVPRRMEDGYGLSRSAIDRALEPGHPRLFIALDCGTNSHDEIAYLRGLGIDVIVIDHHQTKTGLLNDAILINPHVYPTENDDDWRHLCTVGLVFKLAHGLVKHLRSENHPGAHEVKMRDYLDLAAMGTVADLVPLTGENRVIARNGLRILKTTTRSGVRTLMEVAGVRPGQELMPVDISFRLGPRINASGRLADASLSVELLLSNDEKFCKETATQLDAFNRERQDIERQITEEAERMIESQHLDSPGIVLFGENWHPGVVGIVAGRVCRKYNRPCVVLGTETDGSAKGSGRSIDGVNLVEVLAACAAHLTSWGGHPMAVGVALEKEHLAAFRVQFAQSVLRQAGGALTAPTLNISAWLRPEEIHETFMGELERMYPFGQANPEPIFGVRNVVFRYRPEVFREQHFRFQFEDSHGRRLFGVAWKQAHNVPPAGEPINLAVRLAWNFFNDRKLLQLELVDWHRSE